MKISCFLLFGFGCLSLVPSTHADPNFADNFNSYSTGNLVGQGPWLQTSSIATSPIQVTAGGAVAVGGSGQDVYAAFHTTLPNTTGNSLFLGATITVTSAGGASGDYFLHLENTLGSTSGFFDRIFAKPATGGFVLGASDTSSTGTYGSTILSLNTAYRIVLEEDFVAGDKNDTFKVYVNPADLTVAANNTAYESFTWTSTTSEPSPLVGLNFRQGSSGPVVIVDGVDVSGTFSDASSFTPYTVPEPSSFAVLGLGGAVAGLFVFRNRKN